MEHLILVLGLALLGLALIVIDIILIPGFLLSIAGVASIGTSVFFGQRHFGTTVAWIIALAAMGMIVILILLSLRFRLWKRLVLSSFQEHGRGEDASRLATLVGRSGSCLSHLRPSGWVEIDGVKYRAITSGQFLENGQRITVGGFSTGQILVEPVKTD